MSIYGFNTGFLVSTTPKLLAAGSNDLLAIAAAPTGVPVEITEILFSNADSSARTVLLTKFDGSTAWVTIPTKSIAATDLYQFTFPFVLPAGWTLRATPSTANVITAHVTYVKSLAR